MIVFRRARFGPPPAGRASRSDDVSVLWALGGVTTQTHAAKHHLGPPRSRRTYLDAHAAYSRCRTG